MRKVKEGVGTQQKVIEELGCRDGQECVREGREGGSQGGKAVNEPTHCTYQKRSL